ncbi:hypothetical protein KIL84_017912 [Mauremys mutica]|uniref:Uncharacterized protein n=1 Tax=Mauremys mutica TaxID=74926 RepID=A0A9D3XS86_9SAUR|nr:hypothetical protein KIL84_017912 [Mauremys mutica]
MLNSWWWKMSLECQHLQGRIQSCGIGRDLGAKLPWPEEVSLLPGKVEKKIQGSWKTSPERRVRQRLTWSFRYLTEVFKVRLKDISLWHLWDGESLKKGHFPLQRWCMACVFLCTFRTQFYEVLI